MNSALIELFQPGRAREHSLGELRSCYEMYTKSYISKPDFIVLLTENGFQTNRNGTFKMCMRKNIQKQFYEFKL